MLVVHGLARGALGDPDDLSAEASAKAEGVEVVEVVRRAGGDRDHSASPAL